MTYVAPTVADLVARFPEFSQVPEATALAVLNESIDTVGDTWGDADRARAQIYLAAHCLAMEGEPLRSRALAMDMAYTGNSQGQELTKKVGDVSTTYADTAAQSSSQYMQTQYGKKYMSLLRRNFATPFVV